MLNGMPQDDSMDSKDQMKLKEFVLASLSNLLAAGAEDILQGQ